jgi:hypothetical protein
MLLANRQALVDTIRHSLAGYQREMLDALSSLATHPYPKEVVHIHVEVDVGHTAGPSMLHAFFLDSSFGEWFDVDDQGESVYPCSVAAELVAAGGPLLTEEEDQHYEGVLADHATLTGVTVCIWILEVWRSVGARARRRPAITIGIHDDPCALDLRTGRLVAFEWGEGVRRPCTDEERLVWEAGG